MYNDSAQFGAFDGKDNRRTVLEIFARMSRGVPESIARERRKMALERLIALSGNGFAASMVQIEPCSAVGAYFFFTAITGCLGVDVNQAAIQLEQEARKDFVHV